MSLSPITGDRDVRGDTTVIQQGYGTPMAIEKSTVLED